ELINGQAVGFDVTRRLIELAPTHHRVEYVHSADLLNRNHPKFDLVWVCLVLGGITDRGLMQVAETLTTSLVETGLLFLVEATGAQPVPGAWRIRTKEYLVSLFPSVALKQVGTYIDVDQEISVLAGRKEISAAKDASSHA